ncbi:MAG: hypothetical protein KBD31_02975 [Proteobacteria bacterium]|nr:hypothetical protein [Pseudomonadota bacterium]
MFKKLLFFIFIKSTLYGELVEFKQKSINDIAIEVKSSNNKLVFSWPKERHCALFKSGDHWWLVFDSSAQEFTLPKDRDLPTGIVEMNPYFEINSSHDVTLFKIKVADGFDISLIKNKNAWVLNVSNHVKQNDLIENGGYVAPINIEHKYNLIHHLKAEIKKWPNCRISNLLNFKEILIENTRNNKRYLVIVTNGDDQGIDSVIETPYYQCLHTKQGVAFEHFSDQLISTRGENELNLTALNAPEEIPSSKAFDIRNKKHAFQVSVFQRITESDLKSLQSDFLKKVDAQTERDPFLSLEKAWISLLSANAMGAISYLGVIEHDFPGIIHHPFVRTLSASAHLFNNSYHKAKDAIFLLPKTIEVQILNSIILSNLNLPIGQSNHLQKVILLIQDYNQELIDQFLSEVFLASINAADYETIVSIFNTIEVPKTSYFKVYYEYAKLLATTYKERALLKSEAISNILDSYAITLLPVQLRAYLTYALITLKYKEKKITADEYIKELKNLQWLWRGDYLEYKILTKISDLYMENHQYLEAISYLEKALEFFEDIFKTLHLDKKIEISLMQFFKEDLYKKVSPLKVIRVFEGYKNYVPDTSDGKSIIKSISTILVNLDLLDQATELLNKEAMGEKNDKTLAKLLLEIANIQLLDNDGEAVISTFEKFPESEKPNYINEIIDLKTKAYVVLNKLDNALQVLSDDNSLESSKKLADFLMIQKMWYKARLRYTDLLMRLELEKNDAIKMECLINLATLNILLEEPHENEVLRISYENFIKTQSKEYQEKFDYVVDDVDKDRFNRKNIEDNLNSVDKIIKTKELTDKKSR